MYLDINIYNINLLIISYIFALIRVNILINISKCSQQYNVCNVFIHIYSITKQFN